MATFVHQWVDGLKCSRAITKVSAEIKRLENLLSFFSPQSDISAINIKAGKESVKVAPETRLILEKSIEVNKESQGVFDITSGSLFLLWRKALSETVLPTKKEIESKNHLVGSSNLELIDNTAFLRIKRQMIDPGAIGKGFIADRSIALYRRYKIKSAYINIGGNVSLLGRKPDGSPWKVGIRDPDFTDRCIGYLKVEDCSVVTSGDYEKYVIIDGKRYHHIIDMRSGYPAKSGLRSVTVVSQSSLLADALATAAFILGLEEGLKLVKRYGTEALFIDEKRNIYLTAQLKEYFYSSNDHNI